MSEPEEAKKAETGGEGAPGQSEPKAAADGAREKVKAAEPAQAQPSAPPPPARGKVLLADDVAVMRNLLVRALRNAGYAVAEARNGSEVLEMVQANRPDLIVMDNMMPVMNGTECLRHLKSSPDTEDIPVIMCTAKTEKRDVLDAAKSGATDYIVKPFKIETVLERIAKHMPPTAG